MFSGNTDPTPYIAATYIIGLVGVFGYSIWTWGQRKKLRKLLEAAGVDEEGQKL